MGCSPSHNRLPRILPYHLGTSSQALPAKVRFRLSRQHPSLWHHLHIYIISLVSTPRLVRSHLPQGPCLTSILMRRLLHGLLVCVRPRHSLRIKVLGPQRLPLLRLHWLQKLRLHPSIKYSSALQPRPKVNPLPTTPSTHLSGYLFFRRTYIYFLIVVACHRPETEPSSPDHAVQHTREGAFSPSTILVTPAERNHSLPEKAIELVPEPPSKDQLPSLPMDVLDTASAISAVPVKDELSPNTARCPELRRETSWVSNSNGSGHGSSEGGRHAFEDVRSGTPQELNGPYPRVKESAPEDDSSETKRKGGLLTNLKRYSSLPRPPSISTRMSIFTRSPSPKLPSRIRAKSPDAMQFREVLSKRTAVERAIGYAHKINELAMYDCGLGDWVASMKERGGPRIPFSFFICLVPITFCSCVAILQVVRKLA